MQDTPKNYNEAAEILGSREGRKIAHNTYLEWVPSQNGADRIGVRLHSIHVVIFWSNGKMTLDSGGWETMTTKERINRYLPKGLDLSQEKNVWYVYDCRPAFLAKGDYVESWNRKYRVSFEDGMIIRPELSLHRMEQCNTKR